MWLTIGVWSVGALLLWPAAPALAALPVGAQPALAGSYSDSNVMAGATSVAITGHYAYVTGYYAGELTAIDISNPSAPVVAGSSAPSTAMLASVTVNIAGGYAFVVSKNRNATCMPGPAPGSCMSGSNDDGSGNSLSIFDIHTNPAQPALLGSVTDANKLFGAYGVAVSGHYAFVAAQGCLGNQPCPNAAVGDDLDVIDISSLSSPTIVATLHNPINLDHTTSVAVSGNYAYLTAFLSDRLTVVDISNPTSPKTVASLNDTTNLVLPADVAVSGNYAYVADQTNLGRFTVVNVSNPASPTVVASIQNGLLNGAYRVRVYGNFAYVSASGSNHEVVVLDISSPTNPRIAGWYSDATRLSNTTGLDVDPTRHYVVATSPLLSSQSQPLYPPYALQPGGPTITGTVSAITLDPVPIGVSITSSSEPANPSAQTSASFSFSPTDAVSTSQCQLDGAPFAPCTSPTTAQYTGLSAGSHTFVVQTADAAGNTASATYTWTVTGPADVSPPTVTGTASYGQTLTASTGMWTGSPTFTFQWQRCNPSGQSCTPISGAVGATYAPVAADVGSTLSVLVTGTTSAGSATAPSSATLIVSGPPQNASPPAISGTATQGQVLTASPGTWGGSPAPTYAYQWEDCNQSGLNCTGIQGATASTYTLAATDVASTVEVIVTAINSQGSAQASSQPTATVGSQPQNGSAPAISGSATEGQTLTASSGTWAGYPAPTYAYQWEDCNQQGQACTAIPGATGSSYVLAVTDLASTVEVAVTASNSAGSAQASSQPTAVVTGAPQNASAPAVSGAATEGQTLTASTGTWAGYPAPTYAYQWQDCNQNGQGCTAIQGATGSTYTLALTDLASTVEVALTATNSVGSAQSSSQPTAVVTGAPQNVSAPAISGTPTQGQTLTASSGTWSGYPAPSYAYQWEDCNQNGQACSAIQGATGSTYTLAVSDLASTVEVVVTASNSVGSAQSSSQPTSVVTGPPQNLAQPGISGVATEGQMLTASSGTWVGSPSPSYAYQWEDCNQNGQGCSAIQGATGSTYTLAVSDLSSTVEVVVTASNTGGSAQASSQPTAIVTGAPQNVSAPAISGTATLGQTLTASPGTWTGYPAPTYAYQWEDCNQNGQACSAIQGATGSTYVVAATDLAYTLEILVTATNTGGSAQASSQSTGTANAQPQDVTAPAISGVATQGQTLTASPGTWSGYPAPTYAYQWEDCNQNGQACAAIQGATASTYTLAGTDLASTVEVAVTASNTVGSAQASSQPTAVVNGPPQSNSAPAISGTAVQGQVLTASSGSWSGSPAPSYAYQWEDCNQNGQGCTTIQGATGSTYTLAASDVASTVEVVVTASNTAGSAQASSQPTATVGSQPQNLTAPAISGVAAQGQVLTASSGSWSGYPAPSYAYQWEDCNQSGLSCSAIQGATGSTYTLAATDEASTVEVVVTASNGAGSAQMSSQPTATVTGPPQNGSAPAVSGTASQGQTLTASSGTWTGYPAPTYAYQWEDCNQSGANCSAIQGATGSTYTLAATDEASTVEVVVTASNSAGSAQASSPPTATVTGPPQNSSAPAISGTAIEGQTLSASSGTWTGYPAPTYAYQWQRCKTGGQSCSPIAGATNQSYTALSADVGSTLTVAVTASNSAGSAQASSTATAQVTSAVGPVTPLLDNFNRPNNTGPPGPNWSHMVVSSSSATNDMYVTGGQLAAYSGSDADYWNPQTYGPNSEVWITVAKRPNADQDPVVLGLRFQNPGLSTASGYQAYWIFRSTPPDQWKISVRTNGVTTGTLASATGPSLKAGDEILFRAIGTTLELWLEDAGNWTKVLSTTDSTYQSAGYLNLSTRDTVVRLTNFGGGTLP